MQYLPKNNVYVYFRYDAASTVMVIMNANDQSVNIDPARFTERMKGFSQAKNIHNGKVLTSLKQIAVPADQTLVLELMR
jgi:hypothetical protein